MKLENEGNRLNGLIEDFHDEITGLVSLRCKKSDEIKRLENSIDDLERRHSREKARY